MPEPRIRYAITGDDVRIAYSVVGDGLPVIQTPPVPFSQVNLATTMPEDRRMWEGMLDKVQLIRYDDRGTGLSDRELTDLSLDAFVADLEAVVEHARLDRFVLWAFITSGPVAITYAARHPERVSHLLLWSTWARTDDVLRLPQAQALISLGSTDWNLFTETAAHAFFGWTEGDVAHRAAALLREGIEQDTWNRIFQSLSHTDVSDLLPLVKAPTLICHTLQAPMPDVSVARELASRIPNAELVILEGPAAGWNLPKEAVAVLDDFLGVRAYGSPGEAVPVPSGSLVTVLFTDLVGHTEMMSRLGDERGREVLREHERITREVLAEHGGTEVKTMGDGFMASFGSVTKAVECAIALQRAFAEREGEPLSVRVGLNAGEPIEEDGDLFGATVILASRIAAKAGGGEILVADTVRGLCTGKGFLFTDHGEFTAKGFEEPVRIYEVNWQTA